MCGLGCDICCCVYSSVYTLYLVISYHKHRLVFCLKKCNLQLKEEEEKVKEREEKKKERRKRRGGGRKEEEERRRKDLCLTLTCT